MPISTLPTSQLPFALELGKYITFLVSKSKTSEAKTMNILAFSFWACGSKWRPPKWEQSVFIQSLL